MRAGAATGGGASEARRTTLRTGVAFALFAVVSLGLTAFIGAQIAQLQVGTDRYALTAVFDDATNLRAGDSVRLAGVPVGQVAGVAVVEGDAEVRFTVDRDVPLPVDSAVAVGWLNLIGQRELQLFPGTADDLLADGDVVTETRSVVDLGALLDELGPLTQAVDPARVNQLVEALVVALSGNREEVAAVVDQLDRVLSTVAAREGTIAQILDDYGTIAGAVARRDAEIQQMLENLALLGGTFAESGAVLEDALARLPGLAVGLRDLLDANAVELGAAVDDLALVTDTVTAHLDDVAATLTGLPDALELVFRSASYGHALTVNAICLAPNPPPCPHPVLLVAGAEGAGRLSTPASFADALLGIERAG